MTERGVIENQLRRQQINDFSGLLYGRITPTDIDGVIEYKGKMYIFFEVKYQNKDLPQGQRMAIERLVNDTYKAGKKSVALIITHDVGDTRQSVPVADCYVKELYYCKEKIWRPPKQLITARKFMDTFLQAQ